jgi:hypothetical protein
MRPARSARGGGSGPARPRTSASAAAGRDDPEKCHGWQLTRPRRRRRGRSRPRSSAAGRRAACRQRRCKARCRRRRTCRDSPVPSGDAGDNPCRRQGDQVVVPTSSGRWAVVEDDHGVWGGRRNRAPRLRGGRRRSPVVLSQGAHARMGVPGGGGGPLGQHPGRSRAGRPRDAGSGPRSPAVAVVVGAGPDGALACRPGRASAQR